MRTHSESKKEALKKVAAGSRKGFLVQRVKGGNPTCRQKSCQQKQATGGRGTVLLPDSGVKNGHLNPERGSWEKNQRKKQSFLDNMKSVEGWHFHQRTEEIATKRRTRGESESSGKGCPKSHLTLPRQEYMASPIFGIPLEKKVPYITRRTALPLRSVGL